MAPNDNIAVDQVTATYKLADKAMGIPVVNEVVSEVKKIADPFTPYVEGTLKMLKNKAESSLSEKVKGKVGSTLESLGSSIDDLACNGLDQLTTAVPSLHTTSTSELMENTRETAFSYLSSAQEVVASFKMGRFGIRLFDVYLSLLETPVSLVSNSLSTQVNGVRRHLGEVRSAGAKRDGELDNDGPLLMELTRALNINALLGLLGMQLVKLEKGAASSRPPKDDIAEIFECIDEQEGSIQYLLNLLSQRGKAQGLGQGAEVQRLTELINSLLAT